MFRGRPHTLPHPSRTLVLLVVFYVLHDRQDPVEPHELNQGVTIQNSGSGACTASRRCGRAVVFHSLLGPDAQFNAHGQCAPRNYGDLEVCGQCDMLGLRIVIQWNREQPRTLDEE